MREFAKAIRAEKGRLDQSGFIHGALVLHQQINAQNGMIPNILRQLSDGHGADLQRLNPAAPEEAVNSAHPLLASLEGVLQVAERVGTLDSRSLPEPGTAALLPEKEKLLTQLQTVHDNADRALGYWHRLGQGDTGHREIHRKLASHHLPEQLIAVAHTSMDLIGKLQNDVGWQYQKLRFDLLDCNGEGPGAAAGADGKATGPEQSGNAAVDVLNQYFKSRPQGGSSMSGPG